VSGTNGGSKACLCWHPQVVADVIAKFADPDSRLPMQRGCSSQGNLEAILFQYLQESPFCQSSAQKLHDDSKMLFNFLLAIRVFAPVERPFAIGASASADAADDSGAEFMVPSSLQGRPSFWREVFDSEALSFSCIRGIRYFSMDPMITVAAFVRAMTRMCSDPARMWGCAFSVPLRNGGLIFVRLAESRDFVDVIVFNGYICHTFCSQPEPMIALRLRSASERTLLSIITSASGASPSQQTSCSTAKEENQDKEGRAPRNMCLKSPAIDSLAQLAAPPCPLPNPKHSSGATIWADPLLLPSTKSFANASLLKMSRTCMKRW
jgi:hypothetical protein